MTANEIFARFSPGQSSEVLEWLMENDKAAYKTAIGLLAGRRKLRPVFVERKPKDERHLWVKEAFAKPANGDLATEILQAWILGAHNAMVCSFLDTLKIPHDGKGLIEDLPAEPGPTEVKAAVEALFAGYPEGAVFAYLHLFSSMDIAEWPTLQQLTTTDPRLCPQTPTH